MIDSSLIPTKKTLFRNAGTQANPVWKHASKNIGAIELFAGPAADIPEGALICNGASVSRNTYADLFALIGTDFGAGDDNTEFKIPDFRDRIPRGSSNDTDLGSQGGNHSITVEQLPAHSHNLLILNPDILGGNFDGDGSDVESIDANTRGLYRNRPTGETGDGDPYTPPYTAVNYIIYT